MIIVNIFDFIALSVVAIGCFCIGFYFSMCFNKAAMGLYGKEEDGLDLPSKGQNHDKKKEQNPWTKSF